MLANGKLIWIHWFTTIGLNCLINYYPVSLSGTSENEPIVQLEQGGQEVNLLKGLTIDISNSSLNQVNYLTSWLIGNNIRCSLKLETQFDSLVKDANSNSVNRLIIWYQVKDSAAIQLWMDSDERLILHPREYFIDLPLIRRDQFRLLIDFQSTKSFKNTPQLIKKLEIDRCWHTYQACPVLSCLSNGISNGVSCTFTPALSFNCSTLGFCIHQDEVCDYEINCPDGSDEENCDRQQQASPSTITPAFNSIEIEDISLTHNGNIKNTTNDCLRCSFEVDYCSWKPVKSSNEFCFWGTCSHDGGLLRTISASSLIHGPTFDHTLGNSNGHYLVLKSLSKKGRSSGSIASLTPMSGHCKLVFHYLTNSRSAQIMIRSSDNSSSFNPFSTIEVIDLDWERSMFTRVEVEVDLGATGEWLYLVSTIKGDESSYLAIDDIYFTKGCYLIHNSSTSTLPGQSITSTSSPIQSESTTFSSSPKTPTRTTTKVLN